MGIFNKKKKTGCEVCHTKNIIKFTSFKIEESAKFPFELGKEQDPSKVLRGFGMAFSDVTQKKPKGTIYLYKIPGPFSVHEFCSLKCAYEYSLASNSLVSYPDPEKQGKIRGISPDIVEINKNLGNPEELKYRGHPAGSF